MLKCNVKIPAVMCMVLTSAITKGMSFGKL